MSEKEIQKLLEERKKNFKLSITNPINEILRIQNRLIISLYQRVIDLEDDVNKLKFG